ncbi:hypothetical protein ACFXTN_037373 [Malus domestica]
MLKIKLKQFPHFQQAAQTWQPKQLPIPRHFLALCRTNPLLQSSPAAQAMVLPHHLIGPCQADYWPLLADVPHHPDDCPMAVPPKKKTRRN